MSDRDVGMGEMHGFNDDSIETALTGRTAGDSPEVAAFVGELRNAYAAEAVPAPTQALTELFTRGLSLEQTAPVAATPRRSRVLAPFNRLGTAAKAVIAAIAIVGASTGLAAADLLPQRVDDTVSKVVPFVARDSADDDGTPDQGPGDAPGTPGADEDDTTTPTIDDDGDDRDYDDGDDNSGPADNSGPGSVNSGRSDDDDDDTTVTTIDDDDSTATTIDDDSTDTTIDDDVDDDRSGSGGDDSDDSDDSGDEPDDSDDRSGSNSGSG